MAISRVKVWSAGEVLLASDLNSEFNNILDNPVSLWSPAAAAVDLNGFELILDADADTSITADTDDRVDFRLFAVDVVRMNTVASAVNGIDFFSAATGGAPYLLAFGSDTDISLNLRSKGTGRVLINGAPVPTQGDTQRLDSATKFVAETIRDRVDVLNDDADLVLAQQFFS